MKNAVYLEIMYYSFHIFFFLKKAAAQLKAR